MTDQPYDATAPDDSIPLAFYAPKGEKRRDRKKPGRKPGGKNLTLPIVELEIKLLEKLARNGKKPDGKQKRQLEHFEKARKLRELLGVGEFAPKPAEADPVETPIEAAPEPEPAAAPVAEEPAATEEPRRKSFDDITNDLRGV